MLKILNPPDCWFDPVLAVLEILNVEFDYELTISKLIGYMDDFNILKNWHNKPNSCSLAS